MSNKFRNQNNPVQKTQTIFRDPWLDSETPFVPKAIPIHLEQHLLESDQSPAREAIAPAGSPSAKALGGASSAAILHPLKGLLKDELKIKTAFRTALGVHTRNAVALMMWFHSPTFG